MASLYQQGINVGATEDVRPLVVVNTAKAGDSFWTAIKWIGGAITLVVGYREAKALYVKHLRREDDGESEESVQE